MKPVFNKGQLNPTITTPSQLVKLCTENVNERQQALLKKYKLDQRILRNMIITYDRPADANGNKLAVTVLFP